MNILSGKWTMRVAALLTGLLVSAGALAQAAPRVAITTSAGVIVVELNPAKAPVSVENFLNYVKKDQYKGTVFHRVIENFMIQGGGMDAALKERPASAPAIINEANNGLKNERGTIAMARLRGINTATTQFFINTVDNGFLDHVSVPPQGITINRGGRPVTIAAEDADSVYGYAVFGKVVEGMDVVDRIRKVETRNAGPHQGVPVTPIVIEKIAVVNSK